MFTVNEYKIVFKRVWHGRKVGAYNVKLRTGRYDTKCEMYCLTETGKSFYNKPTFTGIARLHPNDKPDRVIGKKIALRNAISVRHVDDHGKVSYEYNSIDFHRKELRTAIWKAFLEWVASWSPGHGYLYNDQSKSKIENRNSKMS